MGLKQEFNFREYLTKNIVGFDGKYAQYILMLPTLYDALCSLLESKKLPLSLRADIYLTFGYLFYPNDLYPEEEHGPLGFLDDLMLILVVLRKCAIREEVGLEFIEEHTAELDYSLNQLLTSDFDKITKENKKLFDELLSATGMRDYYR
jgi:uncharacterized membrane protein YkvA (DUF1232 family)|tara:strand:- start:1383 stop:1829 length:447 start_codon:yes stop_codon:yes gene_type:complete